MKFQQKERCWDEEFRQKKEYSIKGLCSDDGREFNINLENILKGKDKIL